MLCFFLMHYTSVTFAQPVLCMQIGQNFVPHDVVGANDNSITHTSSLGGPGWSFQNIEINGLLIVNTNFNIQSCKLKMGSNARIQVEPGVLFQSVGSQYFHCGNKFWKGFFLNGGTSNFYFNHIEDAKIAVEIKSADARAVMLANLFNRNERGVYAQNIAVNALLAGNTFSCHLWLNAGSYYSYTGIELINCPAATIGRTEAVEGYRNKFKDQQRGIYLLNSTATIGLSEFKNNRDCGISARNSVFTIRGAHLNMTSDFSNNEADVMAESSSMNVFYCYMDSCKTNNITSIANNNLEQIHLSDNEIHVTNYPDPQNFKAAIRLDRTRNGNDPTFRNTILRNRIFIHEFGLHDRRGIYVKGAASCRDFMWIDANVIEAEKGGADSHPTKFIDIDISGAENFQITKNVIRSANSYEHGSSRWGIFMVNGANLPAEGNMLWNNQVTGWGGNDNGCCAIHAENAGPWSICSNTTDNTYRGFHFTGNCGESVFGLNNIGDHNADPMNQYVGGAGLIMQGHGADNAFLGDQVCQANYWNPVDYSRPNAFTAILLGKNHDAPSQPTIWSNQFHVQNLADPHQAPIDRNPGSGWFVNGLECLTPTGCVGTLDPKLDEYDARMLDQYPVPNLAPEVEEWQSTRWVLAKLMRYPALNTGDAAAFKNAYAQSSAALYARFDSMLNAVANVTTSVQATLLALEEDIKQKQAQIEALETGISDYTQISPALLQSRSALLAELAMLAQQRDNLREQNALVVNALLDACAQFNNTLPVSQVYEQNQQRINTAAIKIAKGIELSQADKDALHQIAGQCLQVAGRTRSQAAGLLPAEENGGYWLEDTDSHNCPSRAGNRAEAISTGMLLSPNPASDLVKVAFERPASGVLTVYDQMGRALQDIALESPVSNLEIPVSQLSNGIYFLAFRNEAGKTSQSARFMVLR